jgi:hypothetical protein
MNIVDFNEISTELYEHLRAKRIIPVLGSGFTAACISNNGYVPTGKIMKIDMINALLSIQTMDKDELKKELEIASFSKLAMFYKK